MDIFIKINFAVQVNKTLSVPTLSIRKLVVRNVGSMKYISVIFDLGFTLVTFENFTLSNYLKTLNRGLDQMVQYLTETKIITSSATFKAQFKKLRNQNFEQSLINYIETPTEVTLNQTLESLNLPKLKPEIANKAILIYHSTEGAFWKIRPDVEPLLKDLYAKKLKLGVLSNAPFHEGILQILETKKLTQYFKVISSSAQIGFCKPDRRCFEYILNKLGISPEQAIMIGDDLKNDILGAQQLGIKTIYVKKNFKITPMEGPVKVEPDAEISNLMEIIPIIDKWNND
jgi:HAD superfamily hydrolase (TIGR01509 family)